MMPGFWQEIVDKIKDAISGGDDKSSSPGDQHGAPVQSDATDPQ